MKGITSIGRTALLLITAALVLAPAAAANGYSPDAFERAVNARNASLPTPDAFERAVYAHSLSAAPAVGPSVSGPDLVVATDSATPTPGSSFDWDSAAIGGSAMVLLALIVGMVVVATRSGRDRAVLR